MAESTKLPVKDVPKPVVKKAEPKKVVDPVLQAHANQARILISQHEAEIARLQAEIKEIEG